MWICLLIFCVMYRHLIPCKSDSNFWNQFTGSAISSSCCHRQPRTVLLWFSRAKFECLALTWAQHVPHHWSTVRRRGADMLLLQRTATHCNTPQHVATHGNTLQYTVIHCTTLQRTAPHCNTRMPHVPHHWSTEGIHWEEEWQVWVVAVLIWST